MELGSIGLGLLNEGVFCWPVPTEPIEFWIPPAGDPRRATYKEWNIKGSQNKINTATKQTNKANGKYP